MRILLANEHRTGAGGVQTYLASLVPALRAHGHELALAYARPAAEGGPTSIPIDEAWSVADLGLDETISLAREWKPELCYSHNMQPLVVDEALADVAPLVKMMHGYFGTCVSGNKTREFPVAATCPRVCGPGCLVQYLPRRCGSRRPLLMIDQYRWASRQRRLFDRYRAVVVASAHMRDEYVRHGLPTSRVHVVPMFAPPASRTESAALGERVDVLFMGRITPLKGGDRALRAVARAASVLGRPVRLVVAGDGPDRQRLERLARALGVTASFPGWIAAAERDRLLTSAATVIVPSIWPEPFGLVGIEAAAAGVPAVAFGVGGIPEWLTHEVNGLVVDPRAGTEGLGDALVRVLGDDALHARLAANARALISRFSADSHVAALDAVFGSIRRS